MLVLGLTGSVGMGKSTVARMFRYLGVPVFDADRAVHRLFKLAEVRREIIALFPAAGDATGGLDRRKLGALVFENRDALKRLERILHPRVLRLQQRFLHSHRRRQRRLVVLDIPLLFESGGDLLCDLVAVVSAGAELQRRRVLQRPGMNKRKFSRMLAQQMPDAEKRARADILVRTDTPKTQTFRRVGVLARTLSRTAIAAG